MSWLYSAVIKMHTELQEIGAESHISQPSWSINSSPECRMAVWELCVFSGLIEALTASSLQPQGVKEWRVQTLVIYDAANYRNMPQAWQLSLSVICSQTWTGTLQGRKNNSLHHAVSLSANNISKIKIPGKNWLEVLFDDVFWVMCVCTVTAADRKLELRQVVGE